MDSYTGSSSTGAGSPAAKTSRRKVEHQRKRMSRYPRHEHRVTQVPSGAFLSLGLGALVASLGFFVAGRRHAALFLATWVPTILILGNTSKLVKALEKVEGGRMEGAWEGSPSF
jgi:hypothetical protein